MFPVMMNVFEAEDGSCLNPFTASWAVKRGEIALTENSRVTSSSEILERGSEASRATLFAPDIVIFCQLHLFVGKNDDEEQDS